MNEPDLPYPGEVWVVGEASYGPNLWEQIADHGPFIVIYISVHRIGFVAAGGEGPEPITGYYPRGSWSWHEHMVRVWPPVETWDELKQAGLVLSNARDTTH